MTRKEQFAVAALTGLCTNSELAQESMETLSGWAFEAAEELDAAFAIDDCTVEEDK